MRFKKGKFDFSIYTCYNHNGQLGTGDKMERLEPVLVRHKFGKAVQIAAFNERSAAELEDGRWFDCGNIDEAFAPYSMWISE
jgi:hypothetical protein